MNNLFSPKYLRFFIVNQIFDVTIVLYAPKYIPSPIVMSLGVGDQLLWMIEGEISTSGRYGQAWQAWPMPA